ncbi:MAG: GGDEF domain-containing protein, partial [Burkholderiaceae bacterium]|nr:GGDEF domain-containing protein [Burkholderiaceae bacterium]
SRPIARLAQAAQRIAQGDEAATFEPATRSIEIQQLSASVGQMASTLLERKNALEAINRHLESMVAQRTAALEAANQELASLARKDALTGLPNRLAANERLRLEFQQMKRSAVPYALMMMDIDFFKQVNDTHGHPAGDEVLCHVARLLLASLRETDFVGRVGGEEFMVLLPRTDLALAMVIAEKIRAAVESHPIEPVGRVTLSLGVAMASVDQEDVDVAVHQADALLYKAKQGGRNRVASPPTVGAPPEVRAQQEEGRA